MAYDHEKLNQLILERAQSSQLYNNLSQEKKLLFLQDVAAYASHILNNSSAKDIKYYWKVAAYEPEAEGLLHKLKKFHAASFGLPTKSGSFESAIRKTTRDVLFVIVDPKAHGTIKDLLTIRQRAPHISANGINSGRKFFTHEAQPPSTGARSLRRRK